MWGTNDNRVISMRIYVSGEITGYEEQATEWRTEWKKKLEAEGIDVFDPWLDKPRDTRGEKVKLDPDDTVRSDIIDIIKSDAMLLNAETVSVGASQEMVYAMMGKRPVWTILSNREPSHWLISHSDKIFKTIDEFIDWYRKHRRR